MESLFAFIIKHWLEALFTLFSGVMVAWVKKLQAKLKQKQIEQDALVEGMKAILHDMLFQICEKYIDLGYIPLNEMEKIKNREKMIYEAYHKGLNGNSTGTDIHNAFNALPFKNPEDEEDEA